MGHKRGPPPKTWMNVANPTHWPAQREVKGRLMAGVNDEVMAVGLVGAAHLNGRRGRVVQGVDPQTGRVAVQFEGEEGPKRIKPQNLQVLPPLAPPADIPAPPPSTAATAAQRGKKVGRNDKCPCGSRRKYKKCCEAGDLATGGLRGTAERGGGAGTSSRIVTLEMLHLAMDGNMRAVQRLIDDGIDVNSTT